MYIYQYRLEKSLTVLVKFIFVNIFPSDRSGNLF